MSDTPEEDEEFHPPAPAAPVEAEEGSPVPDNVVPLFPSTRAPRIPIFEDED